jgi:hypothetical protein
MRCLARALGLFDAQPYEKHFRGARSFQQVYDILSRLPSHLHLEISQRGDDYGDSESADELKDLFSEYVLHALFRIHTKGMKILEFRNAQYADALALTTNVDKMYDKILRQWPQVHDLVGEDPTLLHRLLSFGECEWEEELLPK